MAYTVSLQKHIYYKEFLDGIKQEYKEDILDDFVLSYTGFNDAPCIKVTFPKEEELKNGNYQFWEMIMFLFMRHCLHLDYGETLYIDF